jgi:hypothetical protein
VTGQRTRPPVLTRQMLTALSREPDGLSTPELARLCMADARQRALTICGNRLRWLRKRGLVRVAGRTSGAFQQGPAVIWSATDAGRRYVLEGP